MSYLWVVERCNWQILPHFKSVAVMSTISCQSHRRWCQSSELKAALHARVNPTGRRVGPTRWAVATAHQCHPSADCKDDGDGSNGWRLSLTSRSNWSTWRLQLYTGVPDGRWVGSTRRPVGSAYVARTLLSCSWNTVWTKLVRQL